MQTVSACGSKYAIMRDSCLQNGGYECLLKAVKVTRLSSLFTEFVAYFLSDLNKK